MEKVAGLIWSFSFGPVNTTISKSLDTSLFANPTLDSVGAGHNEGNFMPLETPALLGMRLQVGLQ